MAIIGFLGLLLGSIYIFDTKPQPIEPVVLGSKLDSKAPTLSPTPNVELTEEAPTETKTTNSVIPKPKATTPSIKLADLIVPYTPEEATAKIDQNTIKNIEQDARLDNVENRVNVIETAPVPVPVPPPTPVDSGNITCYGTDNKTIVCSNSYQFTTVYVTKIVFESGTLTRNVKLIANEPDQYAYQMRRDPDLGTLKSLTYTVNGEEHIINFLWSSTGKYLEI